MNKRLLHTPEGVRDIYGKEYLQKVRLEEFLHETIRLYGFLDIQTPTFEYFDVFSKETGTTPSKNLYKFFDQNGDTLVLRPDFTPSMARCAAKYFMETEEVIRFSYLGNTFINTSSLQGKLKEVTQLGAELIGDDSVYADAEMIALVIEALQNAGLSEFIVSIGQAEFFKGICEAAGIEEETETMLRELISNKNYFGVEALLLSAGTEEKYKRVLQRMTEMSGGIELLREAKQLVDNKRSLEAIGRLEAMYEILCVYGTEGFVSFDLGMLNNYNYYTGVIFRAYTYGVGDAIVRGGRYDNLLSRFGKENPAIGFMIVVDDLMSAMVRQGLLPDMVHHKELLEYNDDNFAEILGKAGKLRKQGIPAELQPHGRGKQQ